MSFKNDALDKADSVIKKMKKEWLSKTNNHLEAGAVTKDILDKTQISFEKKLKFKKDCKKDGSKRAFKDHHLNILF